MVEKKKRNFSKPSKDKQKTLFDLFPRRVDVEQETKGLQHRADAEQPRIDGDLSLPQASSSKVTLDIHVSNGQRDRYKQPYPLFEKQQVSHPTRNNSAQPIAPTDEVIEIVDDEPTAIGVLKTVTSRSKPSSEASTLISPTDTGTPHDPIVLHSSPPKLTAACHNIPKMTYSIFAPRVTRSPAPPNNASKAVKLLEVPYPDEGSQHVRGPQGLFPSFPIHFRLRDSAQRTHIADSVPTKSSPPNIILNKDTAQSSRKPLSPLPFFGPSDRDTYLESIPQEHKHLHPAVARLMDSSDAVLPSSQQLWTDRWHPTRAQEVLGNEETAIYLRDWLRALELQFDSSSPPSATPQDNIKLQINRKGKTKVKENGKNAKRPRIVRAVEKKGRKRRRVDSEDEEDDWIVNSDEFSGEDTSQTESDDDDKAEFRQVTRSRLYRRNDNSNDTPTFPPLAKPSTKPRFDRLTNTMLLTGPPGCGKTAAVYACAEELGWEVFEVYPGIGKRNGANLDHLVGEVGKNHLVRKTQPRGGDMKTSSKSKEPLVTFLEGGKRKKKEIFNGGSSGSDDNLTEIPVKEGPTSSDFRFVATSDTKSRGGQPVEVKPAVRQSVILLEEVDILFKEDTSFWSAVSKFIRDCKRPVVCTCNDPSLIPIDDLPLQTTLTFKPCPSPVVTSYLQSLCYAEGHLLEPETIMQLYESAYDLNVDLPDMPTNAMTAGSPVPDLRRAIHCLQLWGPIKNHIPRPTQCQDSFQDLDWDLRIEKAPNTNVCSPEPQEQTHALHRSELYHADLMSFTDSYLTRNPMDTPYALALDNYPSADDEIGHTILFNSKASARNDAHLGLYDRDEQIASTAIRFSRGSLQARTPRGSTSIMTDAFRTRAPFRAHVDYQIQMIRVIRNILPLSVPFMSCPAVRVDYEPWIRQIVAIDDSQELTLNSGRSGRTTRNSQRYVRTITLSTEEQNVLRVTALGADSLKSDVLPTDPGMDVE